MKFITMGSRLLGGENSVQKMALQAPLLESSAGRSQITRQALHFYHRDLGHLAALDSSYGLSAFEQQTYDSNLEWSVLIDKK